MFLGLFTDLIMVHYKLWDYQGLPHAMFLIPLLLDFSVYPVVAYLFTQSLPATWFAIGTRILIWAFFAIAFEWITLRTGHMEHHMWWTLWLSMVSDTLIFLMITVVYRFYRSAYVHVVKNGEENPV